MASRVVWHQQRVEQQIRSSIAVVLRSFAARGVAEIVESMRRTPLGTRSGPKRARSLPGHPPAVQTGRLMRAIAADDSEAESRLRIREGVKAGQETQYGLYLEVGTDKMKKRPYLRPWLDAVFPRFRAALAGILR